MDNQSYPYLLGLDICSNAFIFSGRLFHVTLPWTLPEVWCFWSFAGIALEQRRWQGRLLAAWHNQAMLRQKNINSAPLLWARLAQAFLLFLPPFSQPLCLPAWRFHIQNKAVCSCSCICSNRDTCSQQCQPALCLLSFGWPSAKLYSPSLHLSPFTDCRAH